MRRVFIYGGCTSRDAVDHFADYGLELHSYIARQSLISAYRPADTALFATDADTRPFQRRMLRGDVIGSLRTHVSEHASEIDLIIWDLVIERVGVHRVRGGGMVTRNKMPLANGVTRDVLEASYTFGTDAHLRLWKWALDRFVLTLKQHDLFDRTIVNATPWALVTRDGSPALSESAMGPEWFNPHVARYWAAAESAGIKVARIPQEAAIADPEHKWGPAYFHFTPRTYRTQLDIITGLTGRPSGRRPARPRA